jgi:hypothetical protein
MVWTVYKLREEGIRLPASTVVFRAKVGVLQVLTGGAKFTTSLIDASGYPPLANMYDASIAKMDASGMLLTRTEIGNGRHGPMEWRQTRWCVVARVESA